MKTLYVHLGQQKTGSTTLQRFCAINREALGAHGVAYPLMPFKYRYVTKARNGHFLIGMTKDKEGNPTPQRQQRRERTAWRLIGEAFETHDAVLLSDERLWDRSANEHPFWESVLQHAEQSGWHVQAIVYLRRQDKLAASWYNQMVEQGGLTGTKPWEQWVAAPRDIQLDFHANLQRIARYLGRGNITVRVYDRAELERDGGNLYTDFLGCLGLQMCEDFQLPERDHNAVSLTPNFQLLLCAINASPHHARVGGDIFRQAAERCSGQPGATPRMAMFSADEARAFMARYEKGNNRIAAEYLHRAGPLFPPDFPQVQKWTADNQWLWGDLLRYFQCVRGLQNEQIAARGTEEAAPEAADAGQTTEWLAHLQPCEVHEQEVYAHVASCLGELFLLRQSLLEAGRHLEPLDAATVECLAQLLLVHARKIAGLQAAEATEPAPGPLARAKRKLLP